MMEINRVGKKNLSISCLSCISFVSDAVVNLAISELEGRNHRDDR